MSQQVLDLSFSDYLLTGLCCWHFYLWCGCRYLWKKTNNYCCNFALFYFQLCSSFLSFHCFLQHPPVLYSSFFNIPVLCWLHLQHGDCASTVERFCDGYVWYHNVLWLCSYTSSCLAIPPVDTSSASGYTASSLNHHSYFYSIFLHRITKMVAG